MTKKFVYLVQGSYLPDIYEGSDEWLLCACLTRRAATAKIKKQSRIIAKLKKKYKPTPRDPFLRTSQRVVDEVAKALGEDRERHAICYYWFTDLTYIIIEVPLENKNVRNPKRKETSKSSSTQTGERTLAK